MSLFDVGSLWVRVEVFYMAVFVPLEDFCFLIIIHGRKNVDLESK